MKFWILLLFLFTIPTFYQLVRPGFFFMQDDLQAFRMHQMFECFKDFQIPCRWIPDMGYQYGYPQFIFYPPSIYYLGAFFHFFNIQFIDSVKIMFILALFLSALFMFIFLKAFLKNTLSAFFGALLYTYAPYKALEVYVRGALSELWSMVFFPLIFWSIYNLIDRQKLRYVIFLGLSLAGLMLTHNLMSLIFAPMALIWCVSLLVLKKRWKTIPKIILGGLLGLGLASFFTLPVISESRYVHLESLVGGYFDYRQHFVNLEKLFVSNHFGYGSSGLDQDNDLTLSTGQLHWLVAVVGFALAFYFFKKQRHISVLTLIFSLVELGVLFMIHQKSTFIWEKLPILHYLQFPWRFLTVSIFLLSILGGITLFYIVSINKKYANIFVIVVMVGIFILQGQFFQPKEWFNISDNDKFSGASWEKQLTISIFDYLPIYAKLPPNKKAPVLPETLEGEVEFVSYQKGSNYQKGEIKVKKEAILRIPLFDFPGMEVRVDGKTVAHWHDDCRGQQYCLGLITFKVEEGTHQFLAQLKDTSIRMMGSIISLTSIFIVGFLIFKSHDKSFK